MLQITYFFDVLLSVFCTMQIKFKKLCLANSAAKGCLYLLISIVSLFSSSVTFGQEKQSYNIENLGQPAPYDIDIKFITRSDKKGTIAWAGINTDSKAGLVGINTDTGKVTNVDFTSYGNINGLILFKKDEKTIYVFGGKPRT